MQLSASFQCAVCSLARSPCPGLFKDGSQSTAWWPPFRQTVNRCKREFCFSFSLSGAVLWTPVDHICSGERMQALNTDVLSMNSELSSQLCHPSGGLSTCLLENVWSQGDRSALRNWGGLLLYSTVFRCRLTNWPNPSWWQPPHGSDSMPEFIKQQEGVKCKKCPSVSLRGSNIKSCLSSFESYVWPQSFQS